MTKQVKQLINGALILTLAGLLSKVLSAMYRIPLQNLTGDLGFYTYQQIYPIIATVIILSLYGFPLAVSRLTVEELKQGHILTYRSYFVPVFIVLFIINGILALLVFMFAPQLSHIMQDEYLVAPLRLSALLFLLIPFLSLFRGVFQAELEMKQTAFSQIIEQLIRVAIIILGSWFIFKGRIDVRFIAELGVVSSLVGMLLAIISLAIFFFRRYPLKLSKLSVTKKTGWTTYFITIVTFGLVAALNHLTLVFIQFIDVLTLVPQLIKSGLTSVTAMEQKGIFDRGIPLIQFGAVLGSSFGLAFIPLITKQTDKKQRQSLENALSLSIYISSGATVGLIVIYTEVNILLFKNDLGTSVLQILALAILLLSLTITASAILQAFGYVRWTVIALAISLLVKVILNYSLIPIWETHGSALATIISLLLLVSLVLSKIYHKIQFSLWKNFRLLPFVGANAAMAFYLFMVKSIVPMTTFTRTQLFVYVILLVSSGALVYFIILLRYNVLDEDQLGTLPMSQKLIKLQKRMRK